MPQAYTALIGALTGTDGLEHVLGTAPSGYTTIIRDIIRTASPAASGNVYLVIQTGSARYTLLPPLVDATTGYHHAEMRQVIPPGSQLIVAAQATAWSIRITGYVLQDTPTSSRRPNFPSLEA
jgi:hypothetical protein